MIYYWILLHLDLVVQNLNKWRTKIWIYHMSGADSSRFVDSNLKWITFKHQLA